MFLLLLMSSALSLTVNELPIVVQDFDGSTASNSLVDAFRASITLKVVSWPVDKTAEEALASNAARAVLIIPSHFGRDMARGVNAPVQFLVDASDANTAKLVTAYAGQIATSYNQQAGGAQTGPIQTAIRLWFNPGLSSKKFYGPGIFVLGISMFPPLLAALAMAKEGELKTILQVYVSSIPAHEFLLGKIIAFMIVALAECLDHVLASVHLLWPELCRRPYARLDRHRPLCVLCCGVWNDGWSGHPQPGLGLAGGGLRRIPARIPAFRPDLPCRKHTGWTPLGLKPRLGPVLHRDRSRCALAGWRMACHVVQGPHYRRDWNPLLRNCMARHEKDAGEGLNHETTLESLFNYRLRALIKKEFAQTRHDRKLMFTLIVLPVIQLMLVGFALSSAVTNVPLAIVDDSRSPESRELIATLTESKSFRLAGYYSSADQLGDAVSQGKADAGMVVPYDYARDLLRDRQTTIQFLLNATNANTATISRGYAESMIQRFNSGLRAQGIHVRVQPIDGSNLARRGQVQLEPAFLYNPGLVDSWFIVTGVLGLLLILDSSLICAAAMVREREAGTLEQLLMSPASTSEIIIAKITPLFLLLFLMMFLAIGVLKFAFGVPFHGNVLLLVAGGALCILSGISIGTVISTFSKSAQQAQLTCFFVNPPLSSLSGALNPVEAMPKWLQPFTVLNPIHHFATIARGSTLKGSGIMDLWPNFLSLLMITLVLGSLSVWRFRKQLS